MRARLSNAEARDYRLSIGVPMWKCAAIESYRIEEWQASFLEEKIVTVYRGVNHF